MLVDYNLKVFHELFSITDTNEFLKYLDKNFEKIFNEVDNKMRFFEVLFVMEDTRKLMLKKIYSLYKILTFAQLTVIFERFINAKMGDELNKAVNNNFDLILNNINFKKIYYTLLLKDIKIEERNKDKFTQYLTFHKKQFIDRIISYEYSTPYYDSLFFIVDHIIKEICENENVDYCDIRKVNSYSAFSSVYIIGSKVLKIGNDRGVFDIPNDKMIINPLIRVDFRKYTGFKSSDPKLNKPPLDIIIEVEELADCSIDMTEEELYQKYKELRNRGIVFTDIKNSNFGRLIKDNTLHWNKPIADIPEAKGFRNGVSEVLPKGEIVIIDTDFLYKDTDKQIHFLPGSHIYEERYKKNKKS